jgi:uncharacterized MAPEG superfamily protein
MTIALWCVLLVGVMPYLTVGIAKAVGGNYDNSDPRGRAAGYEGLAKRAHAAHLNGFEAFPLFAVAVIVAEIKGGLRGTVDLLAVVYVISRMGYVGSYLLNRPSLRSVLWIICFFSAVAIFVSPIWR